MRVPKEAKETKKESCHGESPAGFFLCFIGDSLFYNNIILRYSFLCFDHIYVIIQYVVI